LTDVVISTNEHDWSTKPTMMMMMRLHASLSEPLMFSQARRVSITTFMYSYLEIQLVGWTLNWGV
jgi:hypothetical protein